MLAEPYQLNGFLEAYAEKQEIVLCMQFLTGQLKRY